MKTVLKFILVMVSAVLLNGCTGGLVYTNSGVYPYGGIYYPSPVYPLGPSVYYPYHPHFHDGAHSGYYHHHR